MLELLNELHLHYFHSLNFFLYQSFVFFFCIYSFVIWVSEMIDSSSFEILNCHLAFSWRQSHAVNQFHIFNDSFLLTFRNGSCRLYGLVSLMSNITSPFQESILLILLCGFLSIKSGKLNVLPQCQFLSFSLRCISCLHVCLLLIPGTSRLYRVDSLLRSHNSLSCFYFFIPKEVNSIR